MTAVEDGRAHDPHHARAHPQFLLTGTVMVAVDGMSVADPAAENADTREDEKAQGTEEMFEVTGGMNQTELGVGIDIETADVITRETMSQILGEDINKSHRSCAHLTLHCTN